MRTQLIISSLLTQSVGALLFAAPQALKPGADQQLRAQFAVTRVGANGVVVQAGQVLVVQQDNIRANPAWLNQSYFPNEYKKDGKKVTQSFKDKVIKMPVGGPGAYNFLAVGAKVYLTNIEIKEREIIFSVQSCGVCNPAVPVQLPFRAALAFQFEKGYLETADYDAIQGTLGQVFAIDTSPPPLPPTEQPQPPTATTQPIDQPAQADPPPGPPTVSKGLTVDQVIAILGQPERVADLGSKKIYYYKDMKVTFLDGKVSDIE
jgi:hypothetical protein